MKSRSAPHRAKGSKEDELIEKIRARAKTRGGSHPGSSTRSDAPVRDSDQNARTSIHFSAKALINNAHAILKQVPEHSFLPMIKANAYGHGSVWAARTLIQDRGVRERLYGIGVATPEEARVLREEVGKELDSHQVIAVSGASPWSESVGAICERYAITVALVSDEDFRAFMKGGWASRVRYELKFNTGMNRLGMSASLAQSVLAQLKKLKPEERPQGVLTHLACGEDAQAQVSRKQRDVFQGLKSLFSPAFPQTHFHIANSAAIWTSKHWGLRGFTDVVRPGIALYGVPPWEGAPMRGLIPVATWKARVARIAQVPAGESIGYGATFKVRDKAMKTATLGVGYADGFLRALSSTEKTSGFVLSPRGEVCRVLGRVSMDLVVVEVPDGLKAGEQMTVLGEGVDPWKQARAGGTIPYELLTSIGGRVQRIYD